MTADPVENLRTLHAAEAKALRECRESGTANDKLDAWIKASGKLSKAMREALPSLLDRLTAAEARNRVLEEAVEPFAREADTWWDKISDQARPWIAEPGNVGGDDAEFTIGDLRRARNALRTDEGERG